MGLHLGSGYKLGRGYILVIFEGTFKVGDTFRSGYNKIGLYLGSCLYLGSGIHFGKFLGLHLGLVFILGNVGLRFVRATEASKHTCFLV